MRRWFLVGAASALAVTLAACGGKPSAVTPSAQLSTTEFGQSASPQAYASSVADRRGSGAPEIGGKPMWASNRTHTAAENAQYQFTRNGADFGATDENDYVVKVHAFLDHPPGDLQTLDRSNGDRLLYSARDNVFVVVSRDGAPRTMFKPRGGAAYWTQQKDRESQRQRNGGGAGDQSQG